MVVQRTTLVSIADNRNRLKFNITVTVTISNSANHWLRNALSQFRQDTEIAFHSEQYKKESRVKNVYKLTAFFNPSNAELNPICHLLTLLGVHHSILHVSRVRVN
jgi:hypothetical protein